MRNDLNIILDEFVSRRLDADEYRKWGFVRSFISHVNSCEDISESNNAAAIVWGSDCTYILVVMTDNLPDAAGARQEITNISEMVYNVIK